MQDSALPQDVPGKLEEDNLVVLLWSTIAQITKGLDAAQHAVENEPVLEGSRRVRFAT
jgi:hypothetical protein